MPLTNDDYCWRQAGSESVFSSPYFDVTRDHLVLPTGREVDYHVIRNRRQAAGVVPVDGEGNILLVQQWRHPVQKLLWAIPAGAIDAGESPADAALRELREESGYAAASISKLYTYHPSVGLSSQTYHLFIATGLSCVGSPDANEICAAKFFARRQIEEMIDRNEMMDGLALTSLLLYLRRT